MGSNVSECQEKLGNNKGLFTPRLFTMLTFATAFASNFNIVSMVMLILMQIIGTTPIVCVCILLPLLLLFLKMKTQTLMLTVNGPQ